MGQCQQGERNGAAEDPQRRRGEGGGWRGGVGRAGTLENGSHFIGSAHVL